MRRSAAGVAALLVLALIGVYAVSKSDRAEEASREVTATATTASTLRTTTTTTTSTTSTSTGIGVDSETVSTAPRATTPPTARVGCRNSNDPACGAFSWDPQPPPDQPLTINVRFAPDPPRAGEEVAFDIEYLDPDAPELACSVIAFGDDAAPTHCDLAPRPCGRYGPWTPPAPRALDTRRSEVHVYQQPGTYELVFGGTSVTPGVDPGCTDSRTRRPGDPYGATVRVTLRIDVQP